MLLLGGVPLVATVAETPSQERRLVASQKHRHRGDLGVIAEPAERGHRFGAGNQLFGLLGVTTLDRLKNRRG
jgi:hypothetical protein